MVLVRRHFQNLNRIILKDHLTILGRIYRFDHTYLAFSLIYFHAYFGTKVNVCSKLFSTQLFVAVLCFGGVFLNRRDCTLLALVSDIDRPWPLEPQRECVRPSIAKGQPTMFTITFLDVLLLKFL